MSSKIGMPAKYLLAWPPMAVLAILNGAVRETGYKRFLGELRAHQLSTATAIALFAGYIGAVTRRWRLGSVLESLLVGMEWLLSTVTFEFGLGHYVVKRPWRQLLADYDLRAGRVWPLLLLWIAAAPAVFYLARKGSRTKLV